MKYKSIFLLFLFGSLIGSYGYGQAPANDNYTGAVTLTVNPGYTSDNVTTGTTVGATMSPQASCTGFPAGSGHDDDVWYKFKATRASHIVSLSNITSGNDSYTAHGVEIFRSDENGLTDRINCTSHSFSYYGGSEVLLTGLTVNQTYFVRVYGYSTWSGVPDRINFNISILTPPNPPANDEYTGAVTLTPNSGYNCTNAVAGTTDGATQSPQAACETGRNDDDVWYKFTATGVSHIIKLSGITLVRGDGDQRNIEVFKSNGTAPTERIACTGYSDIEVLLSGLTSGDSYFVRVYAYYDYRGFNARINFNICILSPPNPPANDEYAGAVTLTPNPDYVCTNATAGTTNGATQSAQAACRPGLNDDDVWYKFTATRASHIVRLSNLASVYGDPWALRHIEVFKSLGNQPGDRIACTNYNDTEALLSGLNTGDTYFVRVYAYGDGNGVRDRISFNICILSPVDPPANNEYISATALTVNPGVECTAATPGTTDGATQSIHEACHTENSDDVWFKFTALEASHTVKLANISLAYGTQNGRYAEIFSSAGGLPVSRIFCSSFPDFTETTLTGLTIGESYFIRIYTGAGLHRINFNICVSTPPVPSNDECAAAADISNGSQASGTTNGATQSMNAGSCAGSGTAYDVWYKVIPVSGGALTVIANSIQFDLVIEAFTGACGSLTSIACKNDGAGSESLTIPNALAGTTYYFRVYNYTPAAARVAAETGAFTIQVSGVALPVTLASFKAASSENNSVRLDWATTEESGASHFEVEHSLTGRTWNKIGELKATGNSTSLTSYFHIHTNPSLSFNYYRLKSVDLDGSFAYSAIESVRLGGTSLGGTPLGGNPLGVKELYAYPNPVSDRLYLKRTTLNEISTLKLYNAAGNEVKVSADPGTQSLDVRHLPAGIYLLQADYVDGTSQTFRVLISR